MIMSTRMPLHSEAARAVKSRFGFCEGAAPNPAMSNSPALWTTMSRENSSSSLDGSVISEAEPTDLDDGYANDDISIYSQPNNTEFCDSISFWKENNVQVIIRIRPLSSSETSLHGSSKCIQQESHQALVWTGHPESRFTFDLVADESVSQEKLFSVAGLPMVENCMGGYNSCIFAYGQTGSGKTHTMLGDIEGGTGRHNLNCGMTPRVFEHLFSRIQKQKEARRHENLKFICKCSFLEIYNEQILDLLDPSSSNLQIREDVKRGVYVENLREIEVTCARDAIQQLVQGAANRKVASTNMNRTSSRSHSVFTCIVESKWELQGITHHRFARLNLVDLAGSERQKSSGAEGERLKEATNINKSLSTLGLVIMSLVSASNGKSHHIPYRDSKLTFLLQDSLGGNSKTIIIANISPSLCCSSETLSTLKFAQRAKYIKNNAIVNEDASGDVVAMRTQIQQMKNEISHLRSLVNDEAKDIRNGHSSVSFQDSLGFRKWDRLNVTFNPSVSEKGKYESQSCNVALIGALKREKETRMELKAMIAESEASMKLAKEREDEIQVLKMRLQFREDEIKRLEAVTSGKFLAETHLLKEKVERLKEIGLLQSQIDRNPEVTKFALENLRLKEEIRRLKSFTEENGRNMINEQIVILQQKLLEALDWKLMHDSESSSYQDDGEGSRSMLIHENEFLRIQAIQNQAEMVNLHNNLKSLLDDKEQLERRISDLVRQLEDERAQGMKKTTELSISSSALVGTIAAASQREAQAEKISVELTDENYELRSSLEAAMNMNSELESKLGASVGDQNNLEHQLVEMHEENEKLMGLYEKAMRERDELSRNLYSVTQGIQGDDADRASPRTAAAASQHEPSNLTLSYESCGPLNSPISRAVSESGREAGSRHINGMKHIDGLQDLLLVKGKLEVAEEKLADCMQIVSVINLIEKDSLKCDKLVYEISETDDVIRTTKRELCSIELLHSETNEKKDLLEKKLLSLKYPLSSISSSISCLEEHEAQAEEKVNTLSSWRVQKEEMLSRLLSSKEDIKASIERNCVAEAKLRNHVELLKSKLREKENMQRDEDRIFAKNIANQEISQRNLRFGFKAMELLKAEEEKPKLSSDIDDSRQKITSLRQEIGEFNNELKKIDTEIQSLNSALVKDIQLLGEAQCVYHGIAQEKEALQHIREYHVKGIEQLVLEYQELLFVSLLTEAEMRILGDDLEEYTRRCEELRDLQVSTVQKKRSLEMAERDRPSGLSVRMEEKVQSVMASITEAKKVAEHNHIGVSC